MAFTGKATYSAGTSLPELAEDVSDLIGIVSPYETPLLDAVGDQVPILDPAANCLGGYLKKLCGLRYGVEGQAG